MISLEKLKEVLHYNPATGLFSWKATLSNSAVAGSIAGWEHNKGYLQVTIDGAKYFIHRLAWFYMTGEWPKDEIDHNDLNKKNNIWENLRQANHQNNTQNVRVKSNSSTGFKNVYWEKRRNKYRVSVRANGKRNFVGYYNDFQEACDASEIYMQKHHKEFFTI